MVCDVNFRINQNMHIWRMDMVLAFNTTIWEKNHVGRYGTISTKLLWIFLSFQWTIPEYLSFEKTLRFFWTTRYTTSDYINERERLVFTRFRLCSHHLKIETGRWARIEKENRLCGCGTGVQDELHVLLRCTKTDVRRKFGVRVEDYEDVGVLMDTLDVHKLVSFVYACMKIFE